MAISVDFYIIEQLNTPHLLPYTCRLIERFYLAQSLPLYIHLPSQSEAERLDQLLWTFREDSFLPHQLCPVTDDHSPPLLLGWQEPPLQKVFLLNLTTEIPVFYSQFNCVIEIVFSDPTMQQLARDRYRQYREQGCPLTTHKIKASDL